MKTFLIFALALCACILLLGVRIFFGRDKRFPETEIGRNLEMRKRGITCVREDEGCGECSVTCEVRDAKTNSKQ